MDQETKEQSLEPAAKAVVEDVVSLPSQGPGELETRMTDPEISLVFKIQEYLTERAVKHHYACVDLIRLMKKEFPVYYLMGVEDMDIDGGLIRLMFVHTQNAIGFSVDVHCPVGCPMDGKAGISSQTSRFSIFGPPIGLVKTRLTLKDLEDAVKSVKTARNVA